MDLVTKIDGSDREVTIKVDLGEENGQPALEGLRTALLNRGTNMEIVDNVIASHARASLKTYFRAIAKAGMKATKDRGPLTDEEIQVRVDNAVPGIARDRGTGSNDKKLAAAAKAYEMMSAEEQRAYIEQLKAKLKAA